MQHLEDLLWGPEGHYELGEKRPPKRTWKEHADKVEAVLKQRSDWKAKATAAESALKLAQEAFRHTSLGYESRVAELKKQDHDAR